MKKVFTWIVTFLIAALMAACGGSSGGGIVAPPVQVVPVEITAANAPFVTSDSLNAAAFASELGDFSTIGVLGGESAPGMFSKLGKVPMLGVSKVISPVFENSVGSTPCSVDGTVTVSGNIANPLTITVGDTISIVFAMCDDGDGQVLDGAMDITITAFNGSLDTYLFEMGMTVSIASLSMDDGGMNGPAEVDGSFNLLIDTYSNPVTKTIVSGELLSMVAGTRSVTLKDFVSDGQLDEGAFTITVDASGKVESDRFDGQATYITEVPFVASIDSNPYVGEMLITGAGGSSIRVTVLDVETVRLEMDYNGDGAVDETSDVTWEEAIG
jgi:hypothetical protein